MKVSHEEIVRRLQSHAKRGAPLRNLIYIAHFGSVERPETLERGYVLNRFHAAFGLRLSQLQEMLAWESFAGGGTTRYEDFSPAVESAIRAAIRIDDTEER